MKSIVVKFQGKFLPSMKHGDYRVMWLGHIIGESSSWALGAAEGWLIYNIAESNPSSWVGAVFFAAMLPWFIVPLVVGILTDRYSRKKISHVFRGQWRYDYRLFLSLDFSFLFTRTN